MSDGRRGWAPYDRFPDHFFVGLIALQGAYQLQRIGAMQLVCIPCGHLHHAGTGASGHRDRRDWTVGRPSQPDRNHAGDEELDALKNYGLDQWVSGGAQVRGDGSDDALPHHLGGLNGMLGGALFGVIGADTFGGYLIARATSAPARHRQWDHQEPGLRDRDHRGGCREGFSTGAGAEEVGRSTTSAVVISSALSDRSALHALFLYGAREHVGSMAVPLSTRSFRRPISPEDGFSRPASPEHGVSVPAGTRSPPVRMRIKVEGRAESRSCAGADWTPK